jgi:hypothetical protein
LSENSNFTISVSDTYVTYSLAVNQKNFRKELKHLRSFVAKNGNQIHQLAIEISRSHPETKEKVAFEKSVQFRAPTWFNKIDLDVPQAIALILYLVGKPLTSKQITQVMNTQLKKIDLRNVSKHLTSKTSELYGYTVYDEKTSGYSLSDYGKKWLETDLLNTVKDRVQNKSTSPKGRRN